LSCRKMNEWQVFAAEKGDCATATFSRWPCLLQRTRFSSWLRFCGLNPPLDPQAAELSIEGRAVPDYGAPFDFLPVLEPLVPAPVVASVSSRHFYNSIKRVVASETLALPNSPFSCAIICP